MKFSHTQNWVIFSLGYMYSPLGDSSNFFGAIISLCRHRRWEKQVDVVPKLEDFCTVQAHSNIHPYHHAKPMGCLVTDSLEGGECHVGTLKKTVRTGPKPHD